MKTRFLKIATIVISILLIISFACNKNAKPVPSTTSGIVQQGSWKVTLLSSDGSDETHLFTGYSFTFNVNGTLVAVKSSSSVNGTWNSANDDSQDKLIINLGASAPFDELNNDWHIIEKTSAKLRLEDVSGGLSGTELLTFEKN